MESQLTSKAVPEVVYANDGTKYYPCTYCCRAFAHKRYLTLHMRACIKSDVKVIPELPVAKKSPKFKRTPAKKTVPDSPNSETIDLTDEILGNNNTIREENLNMPNPIYKKYKKKKHSKFLGSVSIESHARYYAQNTVEVPQNPEFVTVKSEEPGEPSVKQVVKMKIKRKKKRNALENDQSVQHPCKLCDEIFSDMDELVMHARIEHNQRSNNKRVFPPEELEYFYSVFIRRNKKVCPICSKPVGNKLNWKRHLYTHSSIKKYSCQVCNKQFSRSDHCKYHEQRHQMKVEVLIP